MSGRSHYDVIIIGAGPSGIFAARELSRFACAKILMIEKGSPIENRHCARKSYLQETEKSCFRCNPCHLVSGWGGAGAFSDGKLTLTPLFGGLLEEYLSEAKLIELIGYVDQQYLSFGANTRLYGENHEDLRWMETSAAAADIKFIPGKVRHLGTEYCYKILGQLQEELTGKVEINTSEEVISIIVENNIACGVETNKGHKIRADYVICGPGRSGSEWFMAEAGRLGLSGTTNPVDIGLRIEVPAAIMEHITAKIYESKLVYFAPSFDDRVRTFCMNPHGEVVIESNNGLITVNGHSYADKKTENTNFALLVSKKFTEPFNEPIKYGQNIAALANMLGGGVIVQRLGDLQEGRRSTPERIKRGLVKPTLTRATPGDLSLVLPYRHLLSILEMLKAMEKLAPGICSRHTLLYGVEVKFYSFRLDLTSCLETKINNLFAIGDGAGVTRGLVQASVSGVVAAREIINRLPG